MFRVQILGVALALVVITIVFCIVRSTIVKKDLNEEMKMRVLPLVQPEVQSQKDREIIVYNGSLPDTWDPTEWTVDGEYYYPDYVYWPWVGSRGGVGIRGGYEGAGTWIGTRIMV